MLGKYLFFLLFVNVFSLKILIYQTVIGKSHVNFSGTLTDLLVKRGHTVDKLMMHWATSEDRIGTTNARKVYRVKLEGKTPFEHSYRDVDLMKDVEIYPDCPSYTETRIRLTQTLLNNSKLMEELINEKYDFGLSALFDGTGFGIFHILNIKSYIGYVPTGENYGLRTMFGVPSPPSFVPSSVHDIHINSDNLSFTQRLHNFFQTIQLSYGISTFTESVQDVFDEKYPNFPSLTSLYQNQAYTVMNSHPLLDIQKPITAKIKQIGGIGVKKSKDKKLSKEFEEILNSGEKGTVLFSFGTFMKTKSMSKEIKRDLATALSKFRDYNFIWKVDDVNDDNTFFKDIKNLYRFDWVPQGQLLKDDRLSLFITHSGQNSFLETSFAGVPVIAIPLFADQVYNAGCFERNKVGIIIPKTKLNGESLTGALKTVLNDSTYKKNAQKMARMIELYPEDPAKVFVELVEYAAEFPELGNHLQLFGVNLSSFVYYSLDVIIFLTTITVIVVVFVCKISSKVLKQKNLTKKSKNAKKKQN